MQRLYQTPGLIPLTRLHITCDCLVVAFLCVLLAATDAPCLDPLIQWRLETGNFLILSFYLFAEIYL